MPRIIVTTDQDSRPENSTVLLDESVHSVHLSSDHAATQLVQRLAWAISDAESAEGSRHERVSRSAPARGPRTRSRAGTRRAVNA